MNVIYVINICFQCSFPTPEPPDGCSAPPGRTSEGSWWRWRLLCKPQTHIDEARGWSIEHKTSKVAYDDVNMNSVDCQATLLPAILSSKHLRPLSKRFLTRERKGYTSHYSKKPIWKHPFHRIRRSTDNDEVSGKQRKSAGTSIEKAQKRGRFYVEHVKCA